MKLLTKTTAGFLCALLLLPVAGCGKANNILYYRYNYDLSDYIDLGMYDGIPANYTPSVVTDDDVNMEIQSTLAYYATEEEIDTGAAFGNVVYFTANAVYNDSVVAEYCEEDGSLTLGFDHYGDAIDEALTGAKAGDVIESTRTLPDADSYGDYAGATLVYTITVEKVCRKIIPELTDMFVQAYLNFDSADEYRQTVREALEEQSASVRSTVVLSQVWPTLVESTTVKKYPEKELGEIRDQVNMEINNYVLTVGINRDEYIKVVYNMTEEEFDAHVEELAKAQVKEEMILYAVARAENLEVTDEQYDKYAVIYASNYGYSSTEEMENVYGKDVIRAGVLSDVTKQWIADHANISES